MPRLTGRDYKRSRRSPLELHRYRQFLYGTGVGILVASVAFLYVGARPHQAESAGTASDPHHAVLAAADGSAPGTGNGQTFAYPDIAAKTVVPAPAKETHVKRGLPAGQRAPATAR